MSSEGLDCFGTDNVSSTSKTEISRALDLLERAELYLNGDVQMGALMHYRLGWEVPVRVR